ncbi:MAG: hypothetical protein DWB42_21470 [Chloroflexi bacterium]|nr:hypothetical protein [Chloroflexota bacterium]
MRLGGRLHFFGQEVCLAASPPFALTGKNLPLMVEYRSFYPRYDQFEMLKNRLGIAAPKQPMQGNMGVHPANPILSQ